MKGGMPEKLKRQRTPSEAQPPQQQEPPQQPPAGKPPTPKAATPQAAGGPVDANELARLRNELAAEQARPPSHSLSIPFFLVAFHCAVQGSTSTTPPLNKTLGSAPSGEAQKGCRGPDEGPEAAEGQSGAGAHRARGRDAEAGGHPVRIAADIRGDSRNCARVCDLTRAGLITGWLCVPLRHNRMEVKREPMVVLREMPRDYRGAFSSPLLYRRLRLLLCSRECCARAAFQTLTLAASSAFARRPLRKTGPLWRRLPRCPVRAPFSCPSLLSMRFCPSSAHR